MKRAPGILLPLAALGLLVACWAQSRPTADPFARAQWGSDRAVIDAINQQRQQVTLSAVGGGRSRRSIGVVAGGARRTFEISWTSRSELEVEIRLPGSIRFVTPPVSMAPGDTVHLDVQSELTQSRLRR